MQLNVKILFLSSFQKPQNSIVLILNLGSQTKKKTKKEQEKKEEMTHEISEIYFNKQSGPKKKFSFPNYVKENERYNV